jgi:hypothetical protein
MNERDKKAVEEFLKQVDADVQAEINAYHADKFGTRISKDPYESPSTICAKSVRYLNTNTTRYYVKRLGCTLYDPNHVSPIYKKQLWNMGPVSKEAFELYLAFLGFRDLAAKGSTYVKSRAERMF